jgi:hypothetical protein
MNNLSKIQFELKAPKNQFNAFGKYKYRNCEDILEAVKPLLEKYKCQLIIRDTIKEAAGIVYVEAEAILIDLETSNTVKVTASAGIDPNKKGMDISQSFGASSSYARKYALNGLFLIDDTKDADATNTHGKDEPVGIDAELVNKLAKCKDITELQMLYSTKEDWSNAEKTLFTNRKKSLK